MTEPSDLESVLKPEELKAERDRTVDILIGDLENVLINICHH
jgi:hypothetical protein